MKKNILSALFILGLVQVVYSSNHTLGTTPFTLFSIQTDTCIQSFSLGPDTSLCIGDSLLLVAPISADSLFFLWSTGDTTNTIPVFFSGAYVLTITSPSCSRSDTISVVFNPIPEVNITADTVCSNLTTTFLNTSISEQDAVFSWAFGDGGTSSSAAMVVQHHYDGPQLNYMASLTIENISGCSNSAAINVVIHPLPIVTSSGVDSFYCENDPAIMLTGTPSGGLFSGPNVQDNPFTIDDFGFFTPSQPGENIPIVYTYQNIAGCINRDTQIVSAVFPLPAVFFTGLDATYCTGGLLDTIRANVMGAIFSGTNLGIVSGAEVSTVVFNPLQLGSYSISLQYTDENGCSNSYQAETTVNPLPPVDLGNDTFLLPGQTITLSGGMSPDYSYLWSNGSTSPTFQVSDPGYYVLTIFFSSTGCGTSDTIFVDLGSATAHSLTDLIELSAFPNPATDQINITIKPLFSGSAPAVLTDLSGKILQCQLIEFQSGQVGHFTILIDQLSAGMYLLKIGNAPGVKIVKG